MAEAEDIDDDEEEDDDLDGLFDDAPDDIEDVVEYFSERLGVDDDTLKELAEDAAETAGIVAALALLDLFSLGWNALDAAKVDAEAAEAEAEDAAAQVGGPDLTAKLSDIASDMADDLGEKLDAAWGDEDGSGVTGLAEINAQSEYSEAKSDADVDEGWELAQYLAEAGACDICQACNGTILPIDDEWWDEFEPDNNHPNCFPAGTLVEGRFVAGLSVEYAGEVLEVMTRSGKRTTLTPNHPVLTSEGFRPARELQIGMQLLSNCGNVDGIRTMVNDEDHPPACIEDVVRSLERSGGSSRVKADPLDLHGDAMGAQSEIHVVGTDRPLLLDVHAKRAKLGGKLGLPLPDVAKPLEVGLGSENLFIEGDLTTPRSGPSGPALPLDSDAVEPQSLPSLTLCFGLAAHVDAKRAESRLKDVSTNAAVLADTKQRGAGHVAIDERADVIDHDGPLSSGTEFGESAIQSRPSDPGFVAELLERSAGLIALDELVEIRNRNFQGQVYDLQSEGGWILANGIVTSNCRCIKVPLSADEAAARGGVDDKAPAVEASGWKDSWPPDVSDRPSVLAGIYDDKIGA